MAGAHHGMCELLRHGMAGSQHGHGKVCVNWPLECKNVTARPLNTGFEILPAQSSEMSKIPLPLFTFTLIKGRPYPYSFSTNSKTSSSVIWKFPCLGPQNALWIQPDNSLLCFLKASYMNIPCHGKCVMVQWLVTSPCFTVTLNTVTAMY